MLAGSEQGQSGGSPSGGHSMESLLSNERPSELSIQMTDAQIKHMVDRFLQWKLPDNFSPDAGISSFKPNFNENTSHPMKHEPVGTNLFDATQAETMSSLHDGRNALRTFQRCRCRHSRRTAWGVWWNAGIR